LKVPIFDFRKDTQARQCPKQAIKRAGMRLRRRGKGIAGFCAVLLEQISDAKPVAI